MSLFKFPRRETAGDALTNLYFAARGLVHGDYGVQATLRATCPYRVIGGVSLALDDESIEERRSRTIPRLQRT